MGFVPKRAETELLSQALKLVMSGGIYVPPMGLGNEGGAEFETAPASGAISAQQNKLQQIQQQAMNSNYQVTTGLEGLALTPRQTDVLALLLQGKPNKIIARELGVSVETIKDHVAAVLKALGVGSRTQAVLAVGQMVQRQPDAHFSTWRVAQP